MVTPNLCGAFGGRGPKKVRPRPSLSFSPGNGYAKPGRKVRRGDKLNNCDRSFQWPLPALGGGEARQQGEKSKHQESHKPESDWNPHRRDNVHCFSWLPALPRPSSAPPGNGYAKPGWSAGLASFQGNVAAQRVPLSAPPGNGYDKPVWGARRVRTQETAATPFAEVFAREWLRQTWAESAAGG